MAVRSAGYQEDIFTARADGTDLRPLLVGVARGHPHRQSDDWDDDNLRGKQAGSASEVDRVGARKSVMGPELRIRRRGNRTTMIGA
jgi:hypothetical protein